MNSRIIPGQKKIVSVKTDENRCLMQKRLLLLDLRGLYDKYKESHPEFSVSFSKFTQLRPKHCILAGRSGTNSVCVCTIHQNVKLMLDVIDIKQLTQNSENLISDYKGCLQEITCTNRGVNDGENRNANCFLDECEKCPGIASFSQLLQQLLERKNFNNVQFSTWIATDRVTLQTQILTTTDFVEELCNKLLVLKPHSFISKQQSQYFQFKKNNLDEDEVLIVLDFNENYKYIIQDASQAFHFNNNQCIPCSILL